LNVILLMVDNFYIKYNGIYFYTKISTLLNSYRYICKRFSVINTTTKHL